MTNEWKNTEYSDEPEPTEICTDVVRLRRNIHHEERVEDGETRTVWVAEEKQISRLDFEQAEWISRSEVLESQLEQDEAVAEIADLVLGAGGA